MVKKASVFHFMLTQNLMVQSVLIVCVMSLFGLVYNAMGYIVVDMGDAFLLMFVGFFGELTMHGSYRYKEFQLFHFCRKRFYRYQMGLNIIQASEVAIVRTVYQLLFRENMIKCYAEDAEISVEVYNQTPCWLELLITNICIFLLIRQIQLILNTCVLDFNTSGIMEISMQHTLRITEQKEKHPKSWNWINLGAKLIGFICMVAVAELICEYKADQLTRPFYIRGIVIVVMAVVWFLLCLVGKKRYVPKYI